jgi:hypothetical protein
MTDTRTRMTEAALTKSFSRRSLLRGVIGASAGAVALSTFGGGFKALTALPSLGPRSASAAALDSDLDILNYALTLEYLEAAAYKAINDANILTGPAKTYFTDFGAAEQEHVDALTKTIQQLGGTPVQMPTFDFSSVPSDAAGIVKFFQTVEDVGASAYLGAAGSIKNLDVLDAALSIHAVEAEHAAALAGLVAPGTDLFAPEAFATPRTPDQVLVIVQPFFGGMPGWPNTGEGGTSTTSRGFTARRQ